MLLTLADVEFLVSMAGERLLEDLSREALSGERTLVLLTRLRRTHSAEQARAALEMARLRQKAADKFGPAAGRMLFTADALEQASDPLARSYRAGLLGGPGITIGDACCGIGADSLALAEVGSVVTGIDVDPVRVTMARHNAAVAGLTANFVVGDVREQPPVGERVFFDPGRRDVNGRRLHDPEAYLPPLSTVRSWPQALIAVKISPGVNLADVGEYGGRLEFLSVEGDLKEAVLWLGAGMRGRQATLLTAGMTHTWISCDEAEPEAHIAEPGRWLLEPDPSILRAGLVRELAVRLDASQLDPTIAYLTCQTLSPSPWVRTWEVFDWMPFNVRRLREYLRQNGVGRVTVKKRGSAVAPEVLLGQLKLRGDEGRTVVLTRYLGRPVVLICSEQPSGCSSDAHGTIHPLLPSIQEGLSDAAGIP